MLFYYWLNISQCGPYVLFFAPFSFSMRYIISPNLMCHICLRQFMSSVCPCSLCSCCAIYVSIPYAPLSYPFKLMNTCHMPYFTMSCPICHSPCDIWPLAYGMCPVPCAIYPCTMWPMPLCLKTMYHISLRLSYAHVSCVLMIYICVPY